MSHPTLGLPPRDLTAGFPEAAARLRAQRPRLAARALEVAVSDDPTFRERHDEASLRGLLGDAEVYVDRLALCIAGDDPSWLRDLADQTATVYRRRKVPLDDIIRLLEGIRASARGVLAGDEMAPADRAIDDAIAVLRWHRRLAGDARKRNPLLEAIYKGG